jgi:hypothetical protein
MPVACVQRNASPLPPNRSTIVPELLWPTTTLPLALTAFATLYDEAPGPVSVPSPVMVPPCQRNASPAVEYVSEVLCPTITCPSVLMAMALENFAKFAMVSRLPSPTMPPPCVQRNASPPLAKPADAVWPTTIVPSPLTP